MIDLIVQVINCPKIDSSTELTLALMIARRCGTMDGRCYASQKTLAADARMHVRTVGRALDELEAKNLIKRVKHAPDQVTGKRLNDDIYLTLPEVTLPATTGPSDSVSKAKRLSVKGQAAQSRIKRDPKDTNKDSSVGLASDAGEIIDGINVSTVVDEIWFMASKKGRERSSKKELASAVRSAIKNRPAGSDAQLFWDRVCLGLRGYFASDDAKKQGGALQPAVHRLLTQERWQPFADEVAPLDPAGSLPEIDQKVADEFGTIEKPGPARQLLWITGFVQRGEWSPERGPRPGHPGCRLDDALLRQHGFEPAADVPDVL